MKHRAKCKLCSGIIQVANDKDVFSCPCGEISMDYIHGCLHANVKQNPSNLIILDDEGNEIIPKKGTACPIIDGHTPDELPPAKHFPEPSRDELIDMLNEMRKSIDNLPQHAQLAPVTHSDLSALLAVLSLIFRSA